MNSIYKENLQIVFDALAYVNCWALIQCMERRPSMGQKGRPTLLCECFRGAWALSWFVGFTQPGGGETTK